MEPRRRHLTAVLVLALGVAASAAVERSARLESAARWNAKMKRAAAERLSRVSAQIGRLGARIESVSRALDQGPVDASTFARAAAPLASPGVGFAWAPVAARQPGKVVLAHPPNGLLRPNMDVIRLAGEDTVRAAMHADGPVAAGRAVTPGAEAFVALMIRATRPEGTAGPEAVTAMVIEAASWSSVVEGGLAGLAPAGLDLSVYDLAPPDQLTLLHHHPSRLAAGRRGDKPAVFESRVIEALGRPVRVDLAIAVPPPGPLFPEWSLFCAGLGFALLAAWLVARPPPVEERRDSAPPPEPVVAVPVPRAVVPAPCPVRVPEPVETLSGSRILIAEDNPTNQLVARRLVERLGCAATVVNNGQEAVDAIRRERFDVVLMDCQMPVLDGFQATAAIRALDLSSANIPIIAVTANVLPEDRKTCLDAGMDDYVPKPIDKLLLGGALRQWVAVSLERRAFRQSATI